jgi:hypothetical protein
MMISSSSGDYAVSAGQENFKYSRKLLVSRPRTGYRQMRPRRLAVNGTRDPPKSSYLFGKYVAFR